jgi:hypothetical protein
MADIDLFINNIRTGVISLFFVSGGDAIEAVSANQSVIITAVQHTAWAVGIVAGLIGIINGICSIQERRKRERNHDKGQV